MKISDTKAYKYAHWCAHSGSSKVPKYVRLQAQQWLDIADGKVKGCFVSIGKYKKIRRLLKIMIHPDLHIDLFSGLEPYAHFLITAAFCTLKADKSRLYETVILEICRKNFKTFNSAVIFIIGMLTEPNFSRFFSVAPDYKLSSELRLAVRKIIKSSPALTAHFKITRDMITCKLNESEYTPLAYSNDRMDGKLANIFLADEAGALDSYPVEAMRSSQITLMNKLGIIISTQYPNENNVFTDEIDYAKKILDGLQIDLTVFALLYEPNDDLISQWQTNDDVIFQSNPVACHNQTVFDNLVKKRTKAILYPNKRENFLCKHCNIRYQSIGTESYIEIDKFKLCSAPQDKDFWKGKNVYIGVDLSESGDNTAVAMVTFHEGKICAKVWGFLPSGRVMLKSEMEKVNYSQLIREGCCIATGEEDSEIIDYGEVEQFIQSLPRKFGVNIIQLGYDRYDALATIQRLEAANDPIDCVDVTQHSSVLHMPIKLIYEAVYNKTFQYEANSMLEINIRNARCTYDTNMHRYVNKKRSQGKIDMVFALIDAVYLLNVNELLDDSGGFAVQC